MKLVYLTPLMLALAVPATATAQSFDFSSPVVTSPTRGPGVWYTDRYPPSGFQTSGGKLIETIAGADFQPSAFLNTQGRSYDLNSNTHNLSIDLTIDSSWAATSKRWAGLWGVGVNPDGSTDTNDIAAYPILEFTTDGGARFRGYNSNTGTWADLVPAGGIVFGNTYTLNVGLIGDTFTYSVGDASASFTSADPVASIGTVILQGYNSGTNYSITWDNLNATSSAVPESATWMMLIGGFGMVGGAMRRRRTSVAFA